WPVRCVWVFSWFLAFREGSPIDIDNDPRRMADLAESVWMSEQPGLIHAGIGRRGLVSMYNFYR
ncbi:MAG: hypothetical protein M3Z43_04665, partial [Bifidobacterium sp.]|nr:hypothetical protein [Bifidobacterium sp.]